MSVKIKPYAYILLWYRIGRNQVNEMVICYNGAIHTVGFIGDTLCWMYVKVAQSCLTL